MRGDIVFVTGYNRKYDISNMRLPNEFLTKVLGTDIRLTEFFICIYLDYFVFICIYIMYISPLQECESLFLTHIVPKYV